MAPPIKKPKILHNEQQIIKIMKSEKERVGLITFGRNQEFKVFKLITIDDLETDYVTCVSCKDSKLLKYDTKNGSHALNSHLAKDYHIKKPANDSNQPTLDQHLSKPVPMQDRQVVYDKIALWCAMENRPFNIVEGGGFKAVIESVIKVTAKNGLIKADDLIPCKQTVINHNETLHKKLRLKLIDYLKKIDYINCTTDHWKDNMSGASYMTICIHYFNNRSKKLEGRVISTFEVGDKTAKTTAAHFKKQLIKLHIESKLQTVVTDSASAMISAFDGMKWSPCAGHNMNLLQKYAFNQQDNKDNPDPIPAITKLIDSAKCLVTRVRRGNFNFELIFKLKQEIDVRWDSTYDMLESIQKNYHVLVQEGTLRSFMDGIPAGLLKELIDILSPLKRMRMDLCSDDHSTFNTVVLTYLKIKKFMVPKADDSPVIQILKRRFLKYLNVKFPVSEHHIIATFLSPEYRSTPKKQCDTKLVKDAMKLLNAYLEEVSESDPEPEIPENIPLSTETETDKLFAEYREKPTASIKVMNELSEYENLELTADEIKMDPFAFWMSKRSKYPKLSRVAFWILACPATSSSSERVFSKLGNMVTSLRNLLEPKTVKKLSFNSSNEDLL